jgi:hypothetical protein
MVPAPKINNAAFSCPRPTFSTSVISHVKKLEVTLRVDSYSARFHHDQAQCTTALLYHTLFFVSLEEYEEIRLEGSHRNQRN